MSYARHSDRRHGARSLVSLSPGDKVRGKTQQQSDWSQKGVGSNPAEIPRLFVVHTPYGGVYRWNRYVTCKPLVRQASPPSRPIMMIVVVNGQRSEWSKVTSGIPQGSVLGPLLFVMFINDLPKTVQCGVKLFFFFFFRYCAGRRLAPHYRTLFADDTKVYVRSDIPGNPDCLQNDITRLQDWSDK